MPRNQSPLPPAARQAQPRAGVPLPAPIRNRLAQSGHVSSAEVKPQQSAAAVRR